MQLTQLSLEEINSYLRGPPSLNVPPTTEFTDDTQRGDTEFSQQYLISGFLTIQNLVDRFILKDGTNISAFVSTSAYAMPTQAYKVDTFWNDASDTCP